MRFLKLSLAAAALAASSAFASPTSPANGVEYLTLTAPQPVSTVGKKVEVVEFFMYHCPHCNALEPVLQQWVKKQGDKISFRRVHMPYSGAKDPEAHLFLTLQAMGKSEELQSKVFHAVHVEHIRLNDDFLIIQWAMKNGIDRDKFLETWNSFGVLTKLRSLSQMIGNYQVEFVPTVVIDGKYQTSPSMVQSATKLGSEPQLFAATLQVMDALVDKAAHAH